MKELSKDVVFSQLVESINKWLTECLFLCGSKLRGKFQLKGMKDQIWNLIEVYSEAIQNKNGDERIKEREKTAEEIASILNSAIENLIRENTQNNFFVIDFSLHKKEIVEKLSFIS